MNEGTCGTCRYWAPSRWPDRKPIAYEYSECRRHAPAHAHAPTVWPVTQADGWCGEYAARASETGSAPRIMPPPPVSAEEMNRPFGPADGSGDWSKRNG